MTSLRKVVLSFLAQPDDAEMLCAGTLIRLAGKGWDVHIATATAGYCGSSKLPAEEIANIRHAEGRRACDPIQGLDPYTGERVSPTTYVDISDVLPRKLDMLACHASQREWLQSHHGMDEYLEETKRHGYQRGAECGFAAAEAFTQHRGHAFPEIDLLHELCNN